MMRLIELPRAPRQLKTSHGMTLVELLVVVALGAILTTQAAPSFKRLIQSSAISSGVNTFLADIRYARHEALRRGGGVVMCRSNAPEAAQTACDAGSGSGGSGWASGWIIFLDLDNDGERDKGEEILRVQAPTPSIDSIVASNASSRIRFAATGRLYNLSSATALRFGSGQFASAVQRLVCVSLSGRARVAGDGSASCAANS